MKVIIIPIYIVFTIAGLILMKLGGNPGTVSLANGQFNISMSTVSAIGFVCYILSFFLFTRIVVMFDLSYIYPLTTGIVQVITLVLSYFIFKENINLNGVIGAILIIVGIIVMNLKFDNTKKGDADKLSEAKIHKVETQIKA